MVHTLAAMGVGSHVDLRPADLVMQLILGPGQTQLGRTNNRKNPSRARRSQLRFENFQRKKVEEKANAEHQKIEKKDNPVAGDTSSSKLILELVSVKDNLWRQVRTAPYYR